ncbi:MAG: 5-bromo-4-chloroindolyl phosphate hydrolysis family protein [Eubacterium sp.]|nr:5-bromo-4-chloroindolyl phosphate hydrolysis family protein [Eubacterium sp.]
MDYIKNLINLGDEILDTVTTAIERNEYKNLSRDIKNKIGNLSEKNKNYVNYSKVDLGKPYNRDNTPFMHNKPNKAVAVTALVLGSIMLTGFSIAAIAVGITSAILNIDGLIALAVIMTFVAAGSSCLTLFGMQRLKLAKKFERYAKIIGPDEYFGIKELADFAGDTSDGILRNLKKMIKSGMLPQARFDDQEKTLMLTESVYRQYISAKKAREAMKSSEAGKNKESSSNKCNDEAMKILQDGEAFISNANLCKDIINDKEFNIKIEQLKSTVEKIFEHLREFPESAGELRKFTNYYLPTTQKLLLAYANLDAKGNLTDSWSTKLEISEAIDTVNKAFEKLLDDMYQDMAWDISSDISVLKTMVKQDGLSEEQ